MRDAILALLVGLWCLLIAYGLVRLVGLGVPGW